MDTLRAFLNGLSTDAQRDFACRCETSVGYLRKAMSAGQMIGEKLCINIERESAAAVRCEDLRPDVDWAYIRQSGAIQPQPQQSEAA